MKSTTKLVVTLVMAIGLLVVLAACQAAAPTPTPCPTCPKCPDPVTCPVPTPCPETVEAPFADLWMASGHADVTAEAFRHWDGDVPAEVPVGCAQCHSSGGFLDYIGADGSAPFAVDAPAATTTVITCTTCHSGTALDKTIFPSGVEITGLGKEAMCMTCHQGRESKVSVDAKIAKFGENLDPDVVPEPLPAKDANSNPTPLSFSNVHYFAAAGTFYGGQVHTGYEYDGKVYDIKTVHVAGYDTCTGCHDPHSLQVKVETCAECHDAATLDDLKNIREPSSSKDYDGDGDNTEGIAFEIEGLQQILLTSIVNYSKEVVGVEIAYDPATYPYFMGLDGKNYTNWTPRLLKAAYNLHVSVKDPGAYAHGGKYIIELLFDSIEDLNAAEKLVTKFDIETITREDMGHFNGAAAAWRDWDADEFTVPANCATCHSADAVIQLSKGQAVTAQPSGNGHTCYTCHDFSSYPPTVLPFKEVTIASGKTISFGETSSNNICIVCHSARAGKITIDKKLATFNVTDLDVIVAPIMQNDKEVKFSFSNSHYQGVAGYWFGTDAQVAYEYEGKTYVGTNPHPLINGQEGCTGCHDAHSAEIPIESCTSCHPGITNVDEIRMDTTDWNGNGDVTEGMRSEYNPIRNAIYDAILAYAKDTVGVGILYNADVYPYWFQDADNDGNIDQLDGANVTYSSWTGRLLKAAYNYNFLRKTSAGWAHNAKYAMQIAYDTIEDLGGDVTLYTRP
jgi:hypothetical protein